MVMSEDHSLVYWSTWVTERRLYGKLIFVGTSSCETILRFVPRKIRKDTIVLYLKAQTFFHYSMFAKVQIRKKALCIFNDIPSSILADIFAHFSLVSNWFTAGQFLWQNKQHSTLSPARFSMCRIPTALPIPIRFLKFYDVLKMCWQVISTRLSRKAL